MNKPLINSPISRNQPNNGKNPFKKSEELPISQQNIQSHKSINDQQSSVQLMIRAHERIRSLQQDNQILRQHVELLTKDNRQVIEKLAKAQDQKLEIYKTNQELKMRIRDLEMKINKNQIREQLESLQKQNKSKHKQYQRYNTSSLFCTGSSRIKKQIGHQFLIEQYELQNKNQPVMNGNDATQVPITKQKYHSSSHHEQSLSYVNKWEQQCSKITKNQSCFLFKARASDHGEIISSLDKKQRNYFNKSSSKDQTVKNYYSYNYFSSNFNKQNRNLSQKIEIPMNSSLAIGRQEPKNAQIRLRSPLIRKNTPRTYKPSCQFHNKNTGTPNVIAQSISESKLTKKYNYTNWRKVNNNLMVWKFANTPHNRPIIIQR